jgi:hypothetical protein
MGQRLIITEEEKNRIKLLYEVTETKTTVPPDESELVVKDVNPFRYEQYVDARRLYSPELKDGDRFYKYKSYEFDEDIKKESEIKLSPKKTIRLNDVDAIITPSEPKIYYDHIKVGLFPGAYTFNILLDVYLDKHYFDSQDYKNLKEFEQQNIKSLEPYIEYLRKELKNYLDKYNKYIKQKTDLQDVPDKYFDIYKIKLKQTDF